LGKFKPEPVWTSVVNYKDEDKVACKNEVIKILKLCKKEDVLINSPAVANLMYINRLRKREATNKDDVIEDTLPVENLTKSTKCSIICLYKIGKKVGSVENGKIWSFSQRIKKWK
jgi:hypothetical protein